MGFWAFGNLGMKGLGVEALRPLGFRLLEIRLRLLLTSPIAKEKKAKLHYSNPKSSKDKHWLSKFRVVGFRAVGHPGLA